MTYQKKEPKIILIKYKGQHFEIKYSKTENNTGCHFSIIVNDPYLKGYTATTFGISLSYGIPNKKDSTITYPVSGTIDFKIKSKIISAIFKKEKIDTILV